MELVSIFKEWFKVGLCSKYFSKAKYFSINKYKTVCTLCTLQDHCSKMKFESCVKGVGCGENVSFENPGSAYIRGHSQKQKTTSVISLH